MYIDRYSCFRQLSWALNLAICLISRIPPARRRWSSRYLDRRACDVIVRGAGESANAVLLVLSIRRRALHERLLHHILSFFVFLRVFADFLLWACKPGHLRLSHGSARLRVTPVPQARPTHVLPSEHLPACGAADVSHHVRSGRHEALLDFVLAHIAHSGEQERRALEAVEALGQRR